MTDSNKEHIDLSPIVFTQFEYGDTRLVLKEPLTLHPRRNMTDMYILNYEPLKIEAFGKTRDELIEDIHMDVVTNWLFFVENDLSSLTQTNREIREALTESLTKEYRYQH